MDQYAYYEIADGTLKKQFRSSDWVEPTTLQARIQTIFANGCLHWASLMPHGLFNFTTLDTTGLSGGLYPEEDTLVMHKGCFLTPLSLTHPSAVYVKETDRPDIAIMMQQCIGREFVGLRQYTDCVIALMPPILMILCMDRVILWVVPGNPPRSKKYMEDSTVCFEDVIEMDDLVLNDVVHVTAEDLESLISRLCEFTRRHIDVCDVMLQMMFDSDYCHPEKAHQLIRSANPPIYEFISIMYTHQVNSLSVLLYNCEVFLGVIRKTSTHSKLMAQHKIATPRIIISSLRELVDYLKAISRRSHQCIHILASGELCNIIGLGIREDSKDYIMNRTAQPSRLTRHNSPKNENLGVLLARRVWDEGYHDSAHAKRIISYIYACSRLKKLAQHLLDGTQIQLDVSAFGFNSLRLRYANLGLIFNIVSCGFVGSSLYYGMFGTNINWTLLNRYLLVKANLEEGDCIGGILWALIGIAMGIMVIVILIGIYLHMMFQSSKGIKDVGSKLGIKVPIKMSYEEQIESELKKL